MTERAAHLVDEVWPPVPVRQWVLTLPHRLRYLPAWDHGLSRAVLGVHARALRDFYRQQAQRQGVLGGRTGTVTAVQRFGGGLNLNVHFHTLALDGVFVRSPVGPLAFLPTCGPSDVEVAQVLGTIRRRVGRLLRRRGLPRVGTRPMGLCPAVLRVLFVRRTDSEISSRKPAPM